MKSMYWRTLNFYVWLILACVGTIALSPQAYGQRRGLHPVLPPLPAWVGLQKPSLIGELAGESPRIWLVQGEVLENLNVPTGTNLYQTSRNVSLQARVTHVYAGPDTLQGQVFALRFYSNDHVPFGLGFNDLAPFLKVEN